jgi:hypothetical protein
LLASLYRRRAFTISLIALTCSGAVSAVADTPLPNPTKGEREQGAASSAPTTPLSPGEGDFEEEFLFNLPDYSSVKTPTAPTKLTRASVLNVIQKPPAEITVSKFRKLRWSPQEERIASQGPVKITYTDPTTNKITTLTAQDLEYDAQKGVAKASGSIQLEREEGQFAGQSIEYNFKTDAGFVTGAILLSPYFRMRGDRIERMTDGTYVVENGYFTTCENQRPDYQIRAGKLTVSPNRFVSARKITFYAGGTALISLPSYRRNLRVSSGASIPRFSFNKTDGIAFRQADTPINRPNEVLDYDLRVNFRRIPAGFVTYQRDLRQAASGLPPLGLLPTLDDPLRGFLEQLSPATYQEYATSRYQEPPEPRTTLFAVLQNDQFVYNRRRSDLIISRFPEFGVRWTNILGRRPTTNDQQPTTNNQQSTTSNLDASAVRQRQGNTPFILDLSASLGGMRELPTRATAGRLSLQASLATQPIILSKNLSMRFGVSSWLNLYSQGSIYSLLSPEFDIHYLPTSTTFFSVGYRYAADAGQTPFVFDRRDIRHELRLRAQFGGPWAFGVMTRYDLERIRAYDTEFAILRNFDCLQIGIGYRARAQQFSIIFNLLPPTPNRAQRRQPPLPNEGTLVTEGKQ